MTYPLGGYGVIAHNRRAGLLPITFTVNTANAGSASDTFILPIGVVTSGTLLVDWGDTPTATDTYTTAGNKTHVYTAGSGIYIVTLDRSPTFTGQPIKFIGVGDILKITDITQWGRAIIWDTLLDSFTDCTNMVVSATDTPDFKDVTSFNQTFRDCSAITTLTNSNSWNVSSCIDMIAMFRGNSLLTSLDLSNWDTSSCTNMGSMFRSTLLTTVPGVSSFNMTNVNDASSMFKDVTLTTAAYDAILIGWEVQAVQNNVIFDGGNSTYTSAGAGGTARAALVADHSWTITDGGGV